MRKLETTPAIRPIAPSPLLELEAKIRRDIYAVTGIDNLPPEKPQTFLAEWRAKHYGIR